MYCINCGNKLASNGKYCSKCGHATGTSKSERSVFHEKDRESLLESSIIDVIKQLDAAVYDEAEITELQLRLLKAKIKALESTLKKTSQAHLFYESVAKISYLEQNHERALHYLDQAAQKKGLKYNETLRLANLIVDKHKSEDEITSKNTKKSNYYFWLFAAVPIAAAGGVIGREFSGVFVIVGLVIILPIYLGVKFSRWYMKRSKASIATVRIISFLNLFAWLLPPIGVFISSATYGMSKYVTRKKVIYIFAAVLGLVLSLANAVYGVSLEL